ncbi:polysaccharide pyruvyl transferase family protein [Microcoleus asticus]|uniref:Pyruvyl transferase EpsO n=1 Tax=Microcoleus asticus IPMA8 TaxID=2563858 RepID=A0ABX2D0C0_9CYAN|nr:polysaccharide pyruvyl transferase family protein [Microcoleus asticus]NQE36001.1 putative pyruvyl transferase EpsO [Microcoleus asticus IPMA8]
MLNNSTMINIKNTLNKGLEKIGAFEECSLLNYPDYLNVGDHLIWLGEVFYLTDVLKTKIKYTAASIADFSEEVMDKQVGKAPIILQGGGNLGDLWRDHQEFREHIISKYRDRQIIIMPQSIYFENTSNLKKAADIFNCHPNLTLFVRENSSEKIAIKYFHNCQVIKTPDIAFQLLNMSCFASNKTGEKSSILYHCRADKELKKDFSPASIFELPNLIVEDWVSSEWKTWRSAKSILNTSQTYPDHTPAIFDSLYDPNIHRTSWILMHKGIAQFSQHRLIITNRLHGHILCILLGIPHIFLGNSYYKNESFYETWTHQVPFCRFVKDSAEIKIAAQELLELYSKA